jgi:hypothetical protein
MADRSWPGAGRRKKQRTRRRSCWHLRAANHARLHYCATGTALSPAEARLLLALTVNLRKPPPPSLDAAAEGPDAGGREVFVLAHLGRTHIASFGSGGTYRHVATCHPDATQLKRNEVSLRRTPRLGRSRSGLAGGPLAFAVDDRRAATPNLTSTPSTEPKRRRPPRLQAKRPWFMVGGTRAPGSGS